MATNYPTLVTTRHVNAGAYIGQLIVPAPSVVPDTRIPCYVGVGSRFAVAKNQQIRRSFVFDAALTFSPVPPYVAVLPFNAANDKSLARIVKSDGTEVKLNQWQFLKNQTTQKYDSVQINSEIFDPVTQYSISFQSVDRTVKDLFPVDEIREFMAVGNGPDADDFIEYQNYYADASVGSMIGGVLSAQIAADPDNDPASLVSSLTTPAAVGVISGTGGVILNTAAAFNHDYNRYYTVRCIAAGGVSPNRTATFEWTAQPVSSGNENLPSVPLDPAAPKPTFTIEETIVSPPSVATTRSQAFELGIVLDLSFGASNFVVGDKWDFNGYGPALIEVDERHANTNQFHEQGAITKAAGSGFATMAYAGTSDPQNTQNALYRVECVSASDTSTKATLQVLRDDPSNIGTITAVNGLLYTAKVGGVAYNDISLAGPGSSSVGLVNPGIPNNPLTVSVSGKVVTVSLATDSAGALISTITQVANAINSTASCPVSATVVGSASAVANPMATGTANVTNGSANVTAGIGSIFSTELKAGSKVRFSSQPNSIYTVLAAPAPTPSTFSVSPAYTGTTVTASALTGGANISVTNNSISVSGAGTTFLTDGLVPGSRIKFSNHLEKVYTVATVPSETALTLTEPFLGATSAVASGTQPGVDVIEVSAPVGATVLGVDGVFSGTLAWAEYGERIGVSGTFGYSFDQSVVPVVLPTMALSNGIVLSLGLSDGPFETDDAFTFKVSAPHQFYQSKDNRAVVLTTDAVAAAGIGTGGVTLSYTTNTPEGGFGIVTPAPTDNAYSPTSSQWRHGSFQMSGNLLLAVRNMHGGPTTSTVSGGNRHVAGNKFSFSATIDGTINWALTSKTSETIAAASILTDVIGNVTGQAASPYLILANVPETVLSVTEAVSGLPISYSLVTTSLGDNTQYIVFVTKPTVDVRVSYIYRGAEPSPGQIYYVTSKHIRPDELYNQPILIRSVEDGRKLLAPSEATNHLYHMNSIAMGDIGAPAIYIVQVKDADGDGIYTDVDFADAITASEAPRAISDLIVLSHFSTLSKQLASVDKMADPFRRRFRMTWIGAPIGTEIGSEEETNSLIQLSRRTLQVYGENPAHGTRVLVAPTYCTRDVKLENNVVTEVTLDGSFVAGALAALVASFSDPAATILRKQLSGFKTIQTYGDSESPNNIALGENNIIFFTDIGSSVFQIEEDVTTDIYAEDHHLINNMTQKMFVVKQVRQELDSKLIGLITPSPESAVGVIRGFLVQQLNALLANNFIGRYQNEDGSERPIDPSKDIIVFQSTQDRTLYHILFAFWLRNEIKRIFGLYSVNSNDFGG